MEKRHLKTTATCGYVVLVCSILSHHRLNARTLIIYYCTATAMYIKSKSMQCNVGHVGAPPFKLI